MQEARIIMPMTGPLSAAVQAAMRNIVSVFGGATVFPAMGHWRHPNGEIIEEIVRVADIAYEPNRENNAKLYDLAWDFRHAANQVEVYLRYGNGNVQMVTAESCMDDGEFDWAALDKARHHTDDLTDVVECHSASEVPTVDKEEAVRWNIGT